MRLPTYLVRAPSGIYHVRWMVPQYLWPTVGLRVIKRSTRTRDSRAALLIAMTLVGRYSALVRALEAGAMSKPTKEEILRSVAAGDVNRFKVSWSDNGMPNVETNGTPEDNAAALAYIDKVGRLPAPAPRSAAIVATETAQPSVANRRTLDEAREKWFAHISRTLRRAKTLGAKQLALNELVLEFGADRLVDSVSSEDCGDYSLLLLDRLAKNTACWRMLYLSHFFKWCQGREIYPRGTNPATGHIPLTEKDKRDSAKHGWKTFTPEQLASIFDPGSLRKIRMKHTRWAAVIGLYTGARVSEIGQLELADFVEQDGLACISFNDEGPQQRVKGESSTRVIPVHFDLIRLGLLARVSMLREAGQKFLFPSIQMGGVNGAGNAPGKGFSRYLRTLGIKTPKGTGKLGMHSFRDTVITRLKKMGCHPDASREYVGHETGTKASRPGGTANGSTGNDAHRRAYEEDFTLQELSRSVLPLLNWVDEGIIDAARVRDVLTESAAEICAPRPLKRDAVRLAGDMRRGRKAGPVPASPEAAHTGKRGRGRPPRQR